MAADELIGKLVKLKSGKVGIVLDTSKISKTVFLSILVYDAGIINMRADDVELLQ